MPFMFACCRMLAEYVDLYVDYMLTTSVARQFGAFYRGFMNVADGPALKLFRAEELEQLVVGSRVRTCSEYC